MVCWNAGRQRQKSVYTRQAVAIHFPHDFQVLSKAHPLPFLACFLCHPTEKDVLSLCSHFPHDFWRECQWGFLIPMLFCRVRLPQLLTKHILKVTEHRLFCNTQKCGSQSCLVLQRRRLQLNSKTIHKFLLGPATLWWLQRTTIWE